MVKYLLIVSAFFCLIACKKDKLPEGTPECIQEIIEQEGGSGNLLTVKRTVVQGENHYWLNTGAMAWDGSEAIINESCDTICMLCGFCLPPPCTSDYDNAVWETIWEK
ncbi:MAG: hypothetical protein ACE5FF_13765 [Saprospiraceae bacterium]